jgi:hypothetical protein
VHANALQADRVEHPGRRFDDTWRRMAIAFGEEQSFHRDRAEPGQIDDGLVLEPVAETPACGDDRVGERQRTDVRGQIHVLAVTGGARDPRRYTGRSAAHGQHRPVCRRPR